MAQSQSLNGWASTPQVQLKVVAPVEGLVNLVSSTKELVPEIMSKSEKLKSKLHLLSQTKNGAFTWSELVTLLTSLGYQKLEVNGSRVKFSNGNAADMISLDRPHPGNELKHYASRQVIQTLREGGLI